MFQYTLRDVGKAAFGWNERNENDSADICNEDGTVKMKEVRNGSPIILCALISLYFTSYAVQYFMFNLYLTKLAGNMFVNAIIFGIAEAIAVLCGGILMSRVADQTVYNIIVVSGIVSYAIFIFLPDIGWPIYIANCVLVGGLGAMQNLGFLIAELRVPPQSLGSVNMIAQTVGVGFGALVPFISQLDGTIPMVISAVYAIVVYVFMYGLPTPGTYLPKADELSEK